MKERFENTPINVSRRSALISTLRVATALGVGYTGIPAWADDTYPNQPITIVVPFSPGGTTDILARIVAQHLTLRWNVSVVVDNRAGAGGNIGTAIVAQAKPDGYTLVLGTIGTHAINASLYKSMPYDPIKDFAPLTRMAMVPNVLVVNPSAPYKSVAEMIAYGKANPEKLTFGSSGNGSTLHLSGELFKMMTGVNMVHVPYKGSSPAVADLLGGQISMIFDNLPSSLPYIKNGKLRGLGVTSSARSELLPDMPTVAEAGVPGYEVMSWFGMWAPAKTPPAILAKLNKEIVDILKLPEVNQLIVSQGAQPYPETPQQFDAFIRGENKKWADIVSRAGISI